MRNVSLLPATDGKDRKQERAQSPFTFLTIRISIKKTNPHILPYYEPCEPEQRRSIYSIYTGSSDDTTHRDRVTEATRQKTFPRTVTFAPPSVTYPVKAQAYKPCR